MKNSVTKIGERIHNALRWSEKYTKTDMVYLVKGSFWLAFAQIIASISSFILAIAFSNFLPKEVYGNYKYILSLAALINSISLTGIGAVIAQSVARKHEGILKLAFLKNFKWSLLGSVVSLCLASYYFFNQNYDLSIAMLIIATLSPLLNSFQLYTYFLNGKKDFQNTAYYGFMPDIISTGALIGIIFITQNVLVILLTYFISNLLPTALAYFLTIKKYQPNNKTEAGDIKYAKHLSFMNAIQIIAAQIDKVIIFHYLGAVQLAVYFFAIAVPEQLRGFLKIGGALTLPKFSENYEQLNIMNVLHRKIPQLLLLSTVITVAYIAIAPTLYKTLFPQYLESIYYSQIFSVNLILTTATMIITQLLQIKYQTKNLYHLNTTVSIVQIILLFIFIYSGAGILGIIYAKILGNLIGLIASYIFARKIKDYLPS
jgi:O-antigen/teichoic acid export membrane protein